MSIRKRILPSGQFRWVCDYTDQEGVRRAKQFKTKELAKDYETTVRLEIRDGVHVADRASITIAEAGELWLTRCQNEELEASTIAYYKTHLALHIAPMLGKTKLSKLTRPMVESFRDRLLTSISRPLAAKVITSLRSLLFDAQRRGLVGQNVAVGVVIKVGDRHRRKIEIPTKEELHAIIAATGELSPKWRAYTITSMFTGLRPSELRGLTWEHVDLDKKVIRVRQRADRYCKMGSPKSEAGTRNFPLAPMVLNVLREWKLACPKHSDLVFPASRRGGILCHAEPWRKWQTVLKAAGMPRKSYRPYDLRHVCASMLIEQGWQPKKIQQVMGHSSIQMTYDIYGHLWQTPEDDAAAMAEVEERLGAKLPTLRAVK